MKKNSVVKYFHINRLILEVRDQKVLLDTDLARLYGTSTKVLNQAVKRNIDRFPEDFMFSLNAEELATIIKNYKHLESLKFSRTLPSVFTEHGALMVASVLNNDIAIQASVEIVRAFVKMRLMLINHKDLAQKIDALESRVTKHDNDFKAVFDAIRSLMALPDQARKKPIGFRA